jgi:DNA topoisomerase-1
VEKNLVRLVFRGKSGGDWDVALEDPLLAAYFATVPKTPRAAPAICYPVVNGRRKKWQGVSDTDINGYLADAASSHISAKDFRTWQGTVVAARSLARALRAGDSSPDAVTVAVKDAAEWLHNTPSVARDSYVDPRVVKHFEQGRAADFRRQPDRAVLDLLTDGAHR